MATDRLAREDQNRAGVAISGNVQVSDTIQELQNPKSILVCGYEKTVEGLRGK